MSERLKEIRETWNLEEMVPVPPGETLDRLDVARRDIAYLWAENAALRTRAEQAELERDENKRQWVASIEYQRVQAKVIGELGAERDALRAEAGRLREAAERAIQRGDTYKGALDRVLRGELVDVANDGPGRRRIEELLASTPLSAAAVERWKAIRESWRTISQIPPRLMPSIETVDGMKFWDALEKIEEALRERGDTMSEWVRHGR